MTPARRVLSTMILPGFLLALATAAVADEPPPAAEAVADSAASVAPAFTVYYFHGTYRCESCLRIEAWTEETVRREFAREIESGWLDWHAINAQEDANAHYAGKYRLSGQAVILAAWKNGEVVRWKSLDEVWDLLQSRDRFHDYIKREVAAFLRADQ